MSTERIIEKSQQLQLFLTQQQHKPIITQAEYQRIVEVAAMMLGHIEQDAHFLQRRYDKAG